jgi:hypothetical protein
MPKKISIADSKELFIEKNSNLDEDNYIIEIKKEDEIKLMEAFEKDDDVITKIKEEQKDETFDPEDKEKLNLENFLQSQKRKWFATIPTVLEFYNSGTSYSNNKFIL